jgi:hypothetical protein
MEELIKKSVFVEDDNVTIEVIYRLDFDAERSCGSLKIFSGKLSEEEENYEIYMELLDCGLSKEDLDQIIAKTIDEIKTGKLDVRM